MSTNMLKSTAITCAVLALSAARCAQADCIGVMAPVTLYDMHDGDMKQIEADGFAFQITPYNNTQTWAVYGYFDANCVARVNFSVPGKPNPPPAAKIPTPAAITDETKQWSEEDPTASESDEEEEHWFWTFSLRKVDYVCCILSLTSYFIYLIAMFASRDTFGNRQVPNTFLWSNSTTEL